MQNRLQPNPNRRRTDRASFPLRVRTRWQRRRLDAELAHGADPSNTPELALRAVQLRSPAVRSQFAAALAKTLADARGPAPYTLTLHPHRPEIRDCAEDLIDLIQRLLDDQPVDVRGAAMTSLLLTPGTSPLDRDSGANLRQAARSARLALDASGSEGHDLPTAAQLLSAWGASPASVVTDRGPRTTTRTEA